MFDLGSPRPSVPVDHISPPGRPVSVPTQHIGFEDIPNPLNEAAYG